MQSGERGSGRVSWGSGMLWGSAPHDPTCCFRWLLLSRYVIKLVAAIGHQLVPNGSHSLLKLGPQTISALVLSLSPTSLGRDVVRRQKPLPPHVTKNSALTIFLLVQEFCHSLLAIHVIEISTLRTNENATNLFSGAVEYRI